MGFAAGLVRRSRSRGKARRAACAVIPLAVALVAASAALSLPQEERASAADNGGSLAPSSALPFDMPSTTVLRASGKKVFAHYISWSPLSLDNKPAGVDYYTRNYLTPTGEGGKYAAVGGKQRDRPLPRPVRAGANWRLLDMEQEVRTAIAAGLDGFAISMVELDGQWADNTKLLLQAADNVDPRFQIVLRPNMISFDDTSAAALAKALAELGRHKSAARLRDGRLVVSPFKSEEWSVSKWKTFLSLMKERHRTPVAFWPVFHNERRWAKSFAPISYGMGNWGDRNPAWNDPRPTHRDSRMGRVAAVHALGAKWMQPVSLADARPREGLFDEAENTTNLRTTWKIAIDSRSEAVHIPTWNDHAEGSQIQPTAKNGGAYLDLNSYYLTWYKTGAAPRIQRDTVYLTHRTHPATARPTYPQRTLMRNRGGSPTRDTVEALTFLTAPARVVVRVGSRTHTCQNDAGIDTCTVPLGTGAVSVTVHRNGVAVAGTATERSVTARPYVLDMDYIASSSGRRPTVKARPTSTPTPSTTSRPRPTPSAGDTVIVGNPASDTYVNQYAAQHNYGDSWSLASRGKPDYVAYLRFHLPTAPAGKRLVSARLTIRTTEQSFAGSTQPHHVHLAADSWSNPATTWQSRPSVSGTRLGTFADAKAPDTRYGTALDVAALSRAAGARRTFAITGIGADNLWFWSTNHVAATHRPTLVLTYR